MSDIAIHNSNGVKDLLQATGPSAAPAAGLPGIAARVASARPVFYFTVPKKLLDESGITKFGLVKLRPDEEILASDMAGNNPVKAATEAVKSSLAVTVRGTARAILAVHDGSADREWSALDPVLRSLVLNAYSHLHNAKADDVRDFLDSCEIAVG